MGLQWGKAQLHASDILVHFVRKRMARHLKCPIPANCVFPISSKTVTWTYDILLKCE